MFSYIFLYSKKKSILTLINTVKCIETKQKYYNCQPSIRNIVTLFVFFYLFICFTLLYLFSFFFVLFFYFIMVKTEITLQNETTNNNKRKCFVWNERTNLRIFTVISFIFLYYFFYLYSNAYVCEWIIEWLNDWLLV